MEKTALRPKTIRVTDAAWKTIERAARVDKRRPSDWVRVTLETAAMERLRQQQVAA